LYGAPAERRTRLALGQRREQLFGVSDVSGDDRARRRQCLTKLAVTSTREQDIVDHREDGAMSIELHAHVCVVERAAAERAQRIALQRGEVAKIAASMPAVKISPSDVITDAPLWAQS